MNFKFFWVPEFSRASATIKDFPFKQDEIKEVWSLVNKKKEQPKMPIKLVHLKTAYIEDSVHDYSVRNGLFRYASRFSSGGHWILVILNTDCPFCNKDMGGIGNFCSQCGETLEF